MKSIAGKQIFDARTNENLSRKRLCELLNNCECSHPEKEISEDVIKMWELGKNALNIEWIPALCKVLNCDAGYIFGEHDEKTGITADVHEATGLTEDSILTLQALKTESTAVKKAAYMFLNDLLDYFEFPTIAIAYEQLKAGEHKDQEYNIMDDDGKFVDFLCGDIDLLILQNRFTRFALTNSDALSRAAFRREWAAKTDEEKAEIISQFELDLKRGK